MKSIVSKIFLSLYFCFQCFAALFNVIVFITLAIWSFFAYGLGGSFKPPIWHLCFVLIVLLILGLYAFYSYITIIAGIANIKIIKNKILTKFQKFSMITFTVIAVPFYIAMMIKPVILKFIIFTIDFVFFHEALSHKLHLY